MTVTNPNSIYGWPLFIMLVSVFLINFLICRMLTATLLKKKFIKRNSDEFKKAVIMWFFPIVGFAGLLMFLYINKFIRFWKSFGKWVALR
jgi:hypothetical protein